MLCLRVKVYISVVSLSLVLNEITGNDIGNKWSPFFVFFLLEFRGQCQRSERPRVREPTPPTLVRTVEHEVLMHYSINWDQSPLGKCVMYVNIYKKNIEISVHRTTFFFFGSYIRVCVCNADTFCMLTIHLHYMCIDWVFFFFFLLSLCTLLLCAFAYRNNLNG